MLNDSSASVREQSPHANTHLTETTKPETNFTDSRPNNVDALKERAQAIVNDKSIDPDSRAIISYALQIDDPWLPELVRRMDVGENITEPLEYTRLEYPRAAAVVEDLSREKRA